MFTRDDGERLSASLQACTFQALSTGGALAERYRGHYGLRFDQADIEHSMGFFDSGPYRVVCHYFHNPAASRGTAFLLHGYFDHTGIYGHAIEFCLRAGYSVVIFDLPGHGLSSGVPARIDSFRDYSAALMRCLELAQQQRLPQPWISIAQSTGGAVLMDAMLERELESHYAFQHMVLLAPLLRPYNWQVSKLLFAATRLLLANTPRNFSSSSHDPAFSEFVKNSDALQSRQLPRDWVLAMIDYQVRFARAKGKNVALDIIQGTADTTVDWRYNLQEIEKKFAGTRTHLIEGARHHLVNESAEYRDKIFAAAAEILGISPAPG